MLFQILGHALVIGDRSHYECFCLRAIDRVREHTQIRCLLAKAIYFAIIIAGQTYHPAPIGLNHMSDLERKLTWFTTDNYHNSMF
jgi:hypothetical protein